MWPVALLLVLSLLAPAVLAAPAASITWGACPAGESGNDCAFVPLPLDPAAPNGTTLDIFVRRFYAAGKPPPVDSIWMVYGGPGDSGSSFSFVAGLWASAGTRTVYLFDQRGSGQSAFMTCSNPPGSFFFPGNASYLAQLDGCLAEILQNNATTLPFITTYNAAVDFRALVALVNPRTVAVYALSYGTYLMNKYMQLPGARFDAVVLDGPAPPNRWALENNAPWVSQVAMDVAAVCAQHSPTCAAALGANGHLPRLVMDAIIDGTLPCLQQLPWLSQESVSHLANFLTGNQSAHVLAGPFWARLKRCSASDVAQLNVFYARRQQMNAPPPPPPPGAPRATDYAFGMAINIGASEVYSYAPAAGQALAYEQQVLLSSRVLADATVELLVSYARLTWPLYTPNATYYRKFAAPTVPVLVIVGTLDPNTPHGNGPWFQSGLGAHVKLVTVPFAAHGTLAFGADCANGIILDFLLSFGAQLDTACLATIPVPDFDGVTADGKTIAAEYFGAGVTLWNGPLVPSPPSPPVPPSPPAPSPTPAPAHHDNSGLTGGSKAGIALGTLVVAALLILGAAIAHRNKKLDRSGDLSRSLIQ